MASCLRGSKAIQLRDIQPTSSVIRTPKKGKEPNIHIIDGIHNIKRRTNVNVLISNYTNKHTLNKGEQVGHLEPPIEDMQQISGDPGSLTVHSITAKRMMAENVEPDAFKLPCHKLRKDIETKLEELLKEYKSQLA